MESSEWTTLTHLLSLAQSFEGEGQYNLAKIARAKADSISRRAAWELNLLGDIETLVRNIEHLAASLDDDDLATAFCAGASALTSGRAPLINEAPHPYVCPHLWASDSRRSPAKCPDCGAWGGSFQWFPPVYWLELVKR
jgi:rubrerythrin